ncbi:MAG TPA: hypothetical protein VML01_11555, partial [Bryobacterales bacterium]|nr:hypothetical protein [Bryobacterales bacterium]
TRAHRLAPGQRAGAVAPGELETRHRLNSPLRVEPPPARCPLGWPDGYCGTDFDKIGWTDSTSFSKAGIPAITIHSLTQETLRFIHTPRDKPELLNLDWYYDTFRLTVAYLAYLDQGL